MRLNPGSHTYQINKDEHEPWPRATCVSTGVQARSDHGRLNTNQPNDAEQNGMQ